MKCNVCGKDCESNNIVHGYSVRPAIAKMIKADYPKWSDESEICKDDLKKYRIRYLTKLMSYHQQNLPESEKVVIDSIADNDLVTKDLNIISEAKLSRGDRIADAVAEFGGSWKFIISFFVVLLVWILINVFTLFKKPFDPYPFILLNLILSCLAAIQAPIIMMSQNRQDAKDRLRSENDFRVNLKAELEIKVLNEKLDHLIADQWEIMKQIQESQNEILDELTNDNGS